MPQMYPSLWAVLYIYFIFAVVIFLAYIYFNFAVTAASTSSSKASPAGLPWGW